MGIYSQFIFPRLMDRTMRDPAFSDARKSLLTEVFGEVLEIGFGSGLNLRYYPKSIQHITTVDVNAGMNTLAEKRIRQSDIRVHHHVLSGEKLPMDDQMFDSVVSTWTLCSIPHVEQALQEIYRVLKPEGRFFFVEHGLCDEPKIQRWQHWLTPLQKVIGDGCHLNRNMKGLLENQGFHFLSINQGYMETLPKIVGYMSQGIALKNPNIG